MTVDDTESPEARARRAYATAVKLLGPRDHSRRELQRKLQSRDFESDLIETTLDELENLNYLDDARYATRYAEQRSAQGYGPLSIRAKLGERGLDSSLISAALDSIDQPWSDSAFEALQHKFTQEQLLDREEKVRGKVARFLQSRGFSTTDALKALKRAQASDPE